MISLDERVLTALASQENIYLDLKGLTRHLVYSLKEES